MGPSGYRLGIAGVMITLLAVTTCDMTNPNQIGVLVPATADQNPSLPQISIKVGGHTRKIHLETFGADTLPPLFVLHGGPGADYRHLMPLSALSERYFVIMWDQRGSGLSERIEADEISFEYWVAEINAVRNHFTHDDVVTLVGESWGGMYAMLYFEHYPEDVAQIALLEPGPLASSLSEPYENKVNNYSLSDDWLNDMVWNMEFLGPYDHEQIDYKWMLVFEEAAGALLCYGNNSTPVWRFGAYLAYTASHKLLDAPRGYDFTSNIGALTDPVLILASDCSALGYEYQVTYHEPLFPNAQVKLIPESGHFTTVDAPDKVLAELKRFLKEYQ